VRLSHYFAKPSPRHWGRPILRLAVVVVGVLNAAFAGAMFADGHLTLGMLAMSVPGLGFLGAVLRHAKNEEQS
jgi:hypothetical protein